jgi:hypothetical protein
VSTGNATAPNRFLLVAVVADVDDPNLGFVLVLLSNPISAKKSFVDFGGGIGFRTIGPVVLLLL